MADIAYYRVSTRDQSVDSQRHELGGQFDEEFLDEGISGSTPAASRPGFAKLLSYIRRGDTLHVYAVDRLGRDAIDVQTTVRALLDKGVVVKVHGLGTIAKGAGELILAVLAQVAEMEKRRILERTAAGRETARAALEATGQTHRGKASLGRPKERDPRQVFQWRMDNDKSIAETAEHFQISEATVKRYCVEGAVLLAKA
jgi:putative DNA-invertase from lambdoid prophage Rac